MVHHWNISSKNSCGEVKREAENKQAGAKMANVHIYLFTYPWLQYGLLDNFKYQEREASNFVSDLTAIAVVSCSN